MACDEHDDDVIESLEAELLEWKERANALAAANAELAGKVFFYAEATTNLLALAVTGPLSREEIGGAFARARLSAEALGFFARSRPCVVPHGMVDGTPEAA